MLWKVRCIIAWVFRILACTLSLIALGAMIYWAVRDTKAFNTAFPPPFSGVALGFALFGLWFLFELLGRLLSWTNPLDNLPRFRDR